jgi:hypothetical protein
LELVASIENQYKLNSNKISLEKYSLDDLKWTETHLAHNPDDYQLWNIRKKVWKTHIINGKMNDDEITGYLKNELSFNVKCIKLHPKSYNVWYHRIWIGNHAQDMDWIRELQLTEMMFALDGRNCKENALKLCSSLLGLS